MSSSDEPGEEVAPEPLLPADLSAAALPFLALISGNEGQTLEFKSSMRHDYATRSVNKELTRAVVKTIAAFLNTEGGRLVIGVSDQHEILGIGVDLESLNKKTNDGFELHLRTVIGNHLGHSVGPKIQITFQQITDKTLVCVTCPRNLSPVFFADGDRQDFYLRDGNQTKSVGVQSTHEYIRDHWPSQGAASASEIRDALLEALEDRLGLLRSQVRTTESTPPWLVVSTERVVALFLKTLAGAHGWKRLFIISPWISPFTDPSSMSFQQLLKRLEEYGTTAYVVTRPPVEDWHKAAIDALGETGRANVALVPNLHMKLYAAQTTTSAFAMLGSANLTQQSFTNREIGVLVTAFADGKRVVAQLDYEAAQIYRTPGRELVYRANF